MSDEAQKPRPSGRGAVTDAIVTLEDVKAALAQRAQLLRALAGTKAELARLDRKLAAADLLIAWAVEEGRLPPDALGIAAAEPAKRGSGSTDRQEPAPKGTPNTPP